MKKQPMPLTTKCEKSWIGAYAESKQILQQHRDQLDLVAGELLKRETLDAQTFKDLMKQSPIAA